MTAWTHERARIASLTRSLAASDPELVAARQNLKELRLAEQIRKVVGTAPSLSDEARSRLALLLTDDGAM